MISKVISDDLLFVLIFRYSKGGGSQNSPLITKRAFHKEMFMRRNVNCIQRGAFVGALLVAVLVGLQLRAGSAQAESLNRTWKVVSSPNVRGYSNNTLLGVATRSSNDAWAVGYSSQD